MQGNRGRGDPFFDFGGPFAGLGGPFAGPDGPFAGFGGFGGHRSLVSSFFGGRDPFEDPFFTRPFGGMLESSLFGPTRHPLMNARAPGFIEHQYSQPNRSRGPIIEELNSDDEKEGGKMEKKVNPRKHSRSSKEPYVEDPDDEAEEKRSKRMQYRDELNGVNNPQSHPHCFTFQSSTVTYGGSAGAYYSSSRTRRTGSDGLTYEESKEADSATGQAAHHLSRGIHEKGYTVARKLNSDGMVNTMETLHNLNEDELAGFEEAWKGNARKHLPGWTEGFNVHEGRGSGSSGQNGLPSRGSRALPSTECSHFWESTKPGVGDREGSSRSQHSGRMSANIGYTTSSSRGRSRAAGSSKMNQVKRH